MQTLSVSILICRTCICLIRRQRRSEGKKEFGEGSQNPGVLAAIATQSPVWVGLVILLALAALVGLLGQLVVLGVAVITRSQQERLTRLPREIGHPEEKLPARAATTCAFRIFSLDFMTKNPGGKKESGEPRQS